MCVFVFYSVLWRSWSGNLNPQKIKIQQGKIKSTGPIILLSLSLSYLNLVGCELNMLIYKINMFSSKETGQCLAFEHLQLNSHKLKETRISKEEEMIVLWIITIIMHWSIEMSLNVLIGPCERVVTRTSCTLPKYYGVSATWRIHVGCQLMQPNLCGSHLSTFLHLLQFQCIPKKKEKKGFQWCSIEYTSSQTT